MKERIVGKEEVMYAFFRLEGKNVLVTYISDKASGVRRARALVHGRAVGTLLKVIYIYS
jgi:hypothetical protein